MYKYYRWAVLIPYIHVNQFLVLLFWPQFCRRIFSPKFATLYVDSKLGSFANFLYLSLISPCQLLPEDVYIESKYSSEGAMGEGVRSAQFGSLAY
jgi:hypothetical protein